MIFFTRGRQSNPPEDVAVFVSKLCFQTLHCMAETKRDNRLVVTDSATVGSIAVAFPAPIIVDVVVFAPVTDVEHEDVLGRGRRKGAVCSKTQRMMDC